MSAPTVLVQCQAALRELGLPVPTSAAQADDTTGQQIFGLWNALGQELYEKYRWKELQRTHVFFTELDRSLYPLPADWVGPLDQTEFDRTDHWPLLGEMTPQQWAVLKGGIVQLGPRMRYRYIGDSIELFPIPTSINGTFTPIELSFEYYAGGWVIMPDGTMANEATSDADRAVYPNRLMVNGIKLKLWEIKGFDTSALTKDYDATFNQAMSRNHGAPRLSLSPRVMPYLIGIGNVPDGNWSNP
jgi:hypothetical protein